MRVRGPSERCGLDAVPECLKSVALVADSAPPAPLLLRPPPLLQERAALQDVFRRKGGPGGGDGTAAGGAGGSFQLPPPDAQQQQQQQPWGASTSSSTSSGGQPGVWAASREWQAAPPADPAGCVCVQVQALRADALLWSTQCLHCLPKELLHPVRLRIRAGLLSVQILRLLPAATAAADGK